MATRRRKKRRRSQANRRLASVLAAAVLVVVALIGVLASYLIEKYTPSKERMSWNEYYSVDSEDEAAVILNDKLTDIKARVIDGEVV